MPTRTTPHERFWVPPGPLARRSFLRMATGTVLGVGAKVRAQEGATRVPIVAGQIGVRHAHAAGKLQAMKTLSLDYRVVGVVETDAASRARAAEQAPYAGMTWLSEEALLASPGLQVVAVEMAMGDSVPTARRCVAAGKHVHLDKPGGEDHAAFVVMRRAAEQAGLTVQMGYMLRYNRAFAFLFEAVRAGWLGEILEVDAAMGKLAAPDFRAELLAWRGAGMFELACHVIDAVVTLLGNPESVTPFARRADGTAAGLLDNQLAVLAYSRALVTIRCNHADPHGMVRRRFQVVGSRGSLEIAPLESGRVRLFLDRAVGGYAKGVHELQFPATGGRYDGEFADLARVVRGEKRLAWDAAHDIAVHETVLRAAGAWRTEDDVRGGGSR